MNSLSFSFILSSTKYIYIYKDWILISNMIFSSLRQGKSVPLSKWILPAEKKRIEKKDGKNWMNVYILWLNPKVSVKKTKTKKKKEEKSSLANLLCSKAIDRTMWTSSVKKNIKWTEREKYSLRSRDSVKK